MFVITLRLFVTLSDSVQQSVNLTTCVQTRNNVLDRRLQQSHNVGDKFILTLDSNEFRKFVSTYEEALFCISSFQCGDTFLGVFLQELSGTLAACVNITAVLPFKLS